MDFDVALIDLTLPDCQGLETFTTIQRHVPTLPIVVLAGLDNDAVALAAVERSAQDYIGKPGLAKKKSAFGYFGIPALFRS
jgi:DNA-binding NarL/FixJ family response regulator